jgi:hypothetical protein
MAALVTGYYYSIRGDKYLQQQWNILKNTIKPPPYPAAKPAILRKPGQKNKTPVPGTVKAQVPTGGGEPEPARPEAVKTERAADTAGVTAAKGNPAPSRADGPKVSAAEPVPAAAANPAGPDTSPKPAVKPKPVLAPRTVTNPEKEPTGSVSDRLKELSGRSYDVYHDRFMDKALPAIRKILGAGRGIFFTLPEEAENLIYHFLQDHYSDPYMNWAESEERTAVQNMGFNLESLEPIIRECFKKL